MSSGYGFAALHCYLNDIADALDPLIDAAESLGSSYVVVLVDARLLYAQHRERSADIALS